MKDKVASSDTGVRAAQLRRKTAMATTFVRVAALLSTIAVGACATARNDEDLTTIEVVGRMPLAFLDQTRPRWGGGIGTRPINLLVWYPADNRSEEADWGVGRPGNLAVRFGHSAEAAPPLQPPLKRPLIVLSHGTGGSAPLLAWLAEPLARAGFIVAAINHHGNTSNERTAEGFALWWERATDISRTVDFLLEHDEFRALIDPSKVGAAGFSLGGYSVLAIAGARTSLAQFNAFCDSAEGAASCGPPPEFPQLLTLFDQIRDRPDVAASLSRHADSFRDPRIRAVMALAPFGIMLTPDSLGEITVPVSIMAGDLDQITPAATNAKRLASEIPTARLTMLPGVGHLTFGPECTSAGSERVPQLCRDGEGVDRKTVHDRVAQDAVTFFRMELGRQ